jgi:hypothetical protein
MRSHDDQRIRLTWKRTEYVGGLNVFDTLLGELIASALGLLKQSPQRFCPLGIAVFDGAQPILDFRLRHGSELDGNVAGGSNHHCCERGHNHACQASTPFSS